MDDKKERKKTLTISTTLTKKIDIPSLAKDGKKSFSVEKKKPFKSFKETKTASKDTSNYKKPENKKILLENLLNNRQLKHLLKKMIKHPLRVN